MEEKGRIFYGTGLDNSNLREGANEARDILHGISDSAVKEGERLDETFSKVGKTLAGVFTVVKFKEFSQKVATVRGEFQQLEIAFKTMLGSGEKADALMSQLIKTAATTPFGMSDIAQASKQLLAYGVQAEDVNETLIRLGDIAAGLSIPIGDLAYLYGTTMVQGRLFTQDLRQFTGRGIPLTEELAKQFGVTKEKVGELVTEGKVGFPEVKKAIESLTSEGSKFGGLMEAQSKTITGQISNIEDSIEQMFNELGKKSEGVISDTLGAVSSLVENWEAVGKTLLVVISAYGAYKAAVIAVAAAHKIAAIWGEVQAFLSLTKTITSAKDAMILLNLATKANPIGLILGVVAAAASAFALFRDKTDAATEAMKREREEAEEFKNKVGTATASMMTQYKNLQVEYKKCKTAHEKTEWIKNNRDKFKELGISVKDVNTAENVFVKNTDAMMTAFKKRAEATAWQSRLEDAYKQRVERQLQLEEERNKRGAGKEVQEEYTRQDFFAGNVQDVGGRVVYTAKGAQRALYQLREGNDAILANLDAKIEKYAQRVQDVETEYSNALKTAGSNSTVELTDEEKKAAEKAAQEKQKAADAAAERAEKISARKRARSIEEREAELEIRQAAIAGMKEGYEKQIKENEIEYDRLILANEKRKEQMLAQLKDEKALEWRQANPKATKEEEIQYRATITEDNLSDIQKQQLAAYAKVAQEMRAQRDKEAQKELTSEFGSYDERLKALRDSWTEIINNLPSQYRAEATKQMNAAVTEFIAANNKVGTVLTSLFSDLSTKSAKDLDDLLAKGRELYDFLDSGEWDAEKGAGLGLTKEQFETLRKSPEQLERIRKGLKDVEAAAFDSKNVWQQLGSAIHSAYTSGQDSKKFKKALDDIQSAAGSLLQAFDFVGQQFSELGDSFANETLSKIGEACTDTSDIIKNSLEGAFAGFLVGGPIGAAIGAGIGLVTKLTTTINKWLDKGHEAAIASLRDSIEELGKAYNNLNDAIERAYSKDKQRLYEDQVRNLEQQNALIEQQIREETAKKKTDEEALRAYREQIEENEKKIAESKESALDALFGADIQNAISDFSSAVTDAWANAENASESARDTVRKMMQSMVTEAIKGYISASGSMDKIRKTLASAFSDEIITAEERQRIEDMAENLAREVEAKYGWADGLFSSSESEAQREASSKGIATASQDSVDELNGRMTAVQGHTYSIAENTKLLLENTAGILRSVIRIEENTDRLEAVETGIKSVRSTLDDIAQKGVRIR